MKEDNMKPVIPKENTRNGAPQWSDDNKLFEIYKSEIYKSVIGDIWNVLEHK